MFQNCAMIILVQWEHSWENWITNWMIQWMSFFHNHSCAMIIAGITTMWPPQL